MQGALTPTPHSDRDNVDTPINPLARLWDAGGNQRSPRTFTQTWGGQTNCTHRQWPQPVFFFPHQLPNKRTFKQTMLFRTSVFKTSSHQNVSAYIISPGHPQLWITLARDYLTHLCFFSIYHIKHLWMELNLNREPAHIKKTQGQILEFCFSSEMIREELNSFLFTTFPKRAYSLPIM